MWIYQPVLFSFLNFLFWIFLAPVDLEQNNENIQSYIRQNGCFKTTVFRGKRFVEGKLFEWHYHMFLDVCSMCWWCMGLVVRAVWASLGDLAMHCPASWMTTKTVHPGGSILYSWCLTRITSQNWLLQSEDRKDIIL